MWLLSLRTQDYIRFYLIALIKCRLTNQSVREKYTDTPLQMWEACSLIFSSVSRINLLHLSLHSIPMSTMHYAST